MSGERVGGIGLQVFGHYVPRKMLTVMGLEGLILVLCIYLALALNSGVLAGAAAPGSVFTMDVLAAALLSLMAMSLLGLYDGPPAGRVLTVLARLALALGLALGLIALVAAIQPGWLPGPDAVAAGFAFALVGLGAERIAFNKVADSAAWKPKILVLGTGTRAASVGQTPYGELPYRVLGFMPPNGVSRQGVPDDQVLTLAEGQRLADFVQEHRVDEIVAAVRDRRGGLPMDELLQCRLAGVAVTDVSRFFERERGQIRLESVNASSLIFGDGFRQDRFRGAVKRAFDLCTSTALFVVSLPVMLAAAAAIKLDSPGPVFYRQERVGRGGSEFRIYKFRSMRQDAEKDGVARWAQTEDDRVTRVGKVIRLLRIDELPQVFNVLKGEMSFVGPRPERPCFVKDLGEQIPYFHSRHSIRPGITGWAQVRYPYGASVEDGYEKLQYDLYYVKNHTLFLDILILIETVKVCLLGRGAR